MSPRRAATTGPLDRAPILFLGAVLALTLVWPAGTIAWSAVRGLARADAPMNLAAASFSLRLAASTAGWVLGVAILATVLAVPAAWVIRRRGWTWLPLFLAPLLVPNYLAYAGWGLLRAPGSAVGDAIERAAQAGWRDLPLEVGRGLAVVGLALWSVPLATLVLGAGLRAIPEAVLDAGRLDGASRGRMLTTLGWPSAVRSVGVVALVMLGSVIPFHLAQVPTLSMEAWAAFDRTDPSRHWEVWLRAGPLLIAAIIGAACIRVSPGRGRWGGDPARESAAEGAPARARAGALAWAAAAAVLALGVLAPLGLFAGNLRRASSITSFLNIHGGSVVWSVETAAITALLEALVSACVAYGLGTRDRRRVRWAVRGMVALALVPGIMVGVALARSANAAWVPAWVGDWRGMVVLGHLARFGAVAALVGLWVSRLEPREEADLRRVDGADGLAGWARACGPWQWPALTGAGLAAGVLGLHEIETTVLLQPPTFTRSLAAQMLSFLHYARTEELCAGAIVVAGSGVLVAGVCAGLWALVIRARIGPPGASKAGAIP